MADSWYRTSFPLHMHSSPSPLKWQQTTMTITVPASAAYYHDVTLAQVPDGDVCVALEKFFNQPPLKNLDCGPWTALHHGLNSVALSRLSYSLECTH